MNTEQRTPNCNIRTRGFTLAEAIMAMVVLGIAAAGVLLPFSSGAKVQAEGIHRTLAANLASDLMEEIIRTDFNQIISKYGTYTESQGHIVSDFYTGVQFTDPMYANFSRGARCEWRPEQDFFILATVWVKYNGREIVSIKRLISR
jgi:prepilin-type N-terminal cleavage/methylation domain-containing protein